MKTREELLEKIKNEVARLKGDDFTFADAMALAESDWNVEALVNEVALAYGEELLHQAPLLLRNTEESNLDKHKTQVRVYVGSETLNFKLIIPMEDLLSDKELTNLITYIEDFRYKCRLIADGQNIYIQAIFFPHQDNIINDND